ncbi:hypothetical protein, partial [Streptomyces benahoarensis]|uniref:hypothetical protein n=1 Tax=Streptomyces benahoarensis TaxID=2595054 RepID=UPI001C8F2C19
RLSTALAKARDDAADHQNDAEIVREILTDAEGELADARTTVAEQAEQIKKLRADLDAAVGAVVLLSYGQLVSVHPDRAAAQQHAASLSGPISWRPRGDAPASELQWCTAALSKFAQPREMNRGEGR